MQTVNVSSKTERIGVFGGSFNPIHIGHLVTAQTALERYELDRVLFMPCAIQPHKDPRLLAPADVRGRMVEAAIMDNPAFELLDVELQRGGVSYTIDSLKEVGSRFPRAELFLMVGSDTLMELHAWKSIDEILTRCRFIVFARPGYDLDRLSADALRLADPWPERLLQNACQIRQIDVSATEIRHRVAEGLSIRYLVPQVVEMIIMEHNLYR
jgi:nicotinate-nucleotide adenylyltransferase